MKRVSEGEDRQQRIQFPDDDWRGYRRMVLSKLDDLSDRMKSMDEKIQAVQTNVVELKVKAGIWGLMGGLIPVLITLAIAVILAYMRLKTS